MNSVQYAAVQEKVKQLRGEQARAKEYAEKAAQEAQDWHQRYATLGVQIAELERDG